MESGEPYHWDSTGGVSVWWRWTAPFSGRLVVDTFGSDFDTLLAAYTGTSVSTLTLIAANDDTVGLQSQISLDVVAEPSTRSRWTVIPATPAISW